MKIKLILLMMLTFASVSSQATLFSRGGGTMYYDDVLDVTWLQDANYANTSSYVTITGARDVTLTNGRMSWDEAVEWADQLSFGGANDWRLYDVKPINGSSFDTSFSFDGSTDVGFNITSPQSELSYMYHVNLGNSGGLDTSGSLSACFPNCLNNTGSFSNVDSLGYWSRVESAANPSKGWFFGSQLAIQNRADKTGQLFAWAVLSGDVATVPVLPAFWLFGSALIGLITVNRKRGQ